MVVDKKSLVVRLVLIFLINSISHPSDSFYIIGIQLFPYIFLCGYLQYDLPQMRHRPKAGQGMDLTKTIRVASGVVPDTLRVVKCVIPLWICLKIKISYVFMVGTTERKNGIGLSDWYAIRDTCSKGGGHCSDFYNF